MAKLDEFLISDNNIDKKNNIQNYYMSKVRELLNDRYSNLDIPLAYVHAYGCQQNVSDTEKLKGMLALMGYGFTDSYENAQLVLYNTCAVRKNAEDRVFGNVGALKHYKRRNPNLIIALCGCMVQQRHILDKIKSSFPYVDLVFGTHVHHELPKFLFQIISSANKVFDISNNSNSIVEDLPIKRDGDIKAWVPIMYGCNKFCTYCIVPFVRGRERSRSASNIISEITDLVSNGYKEFTLLGQNVNSYGLDFDNSTDFSELLKQINDIKGNFRVRFMSPHPQDATPRMFDTIANCEKICNHIHLPVQSGNNKVLLDMNRSYTREEYLDLIKYAKSVIKDVSFTSDIIVGFPGESYEEFLDTISLVKHVKYLSLYTFIYSSRQGTKAAKLNDFISKEEKSKWFQQLLREQDKIGLECYKNFIGSRQRVLVDSIGKTSNGFISGRTEGNVITEFKGDESLIGKFVEVEIVDNLKWALIGKLIERV